MRITGAIMSKELWKTIHGFKRKYIVSNKGRIFSRRTHKILKPRLNRDGYYYHPFYMSWDSKRQRPICKSKTIHRLVAIAFVPNPYRLPWVNHLDGNKANNNYTNLEWVTREGNAKHAREMGLYKKGYKNTWTHISKEDAEYIRSVYKPKTKEYSGVALAKRFNVCRGTISNIINFRGGYTQ